MPRTTGLNIRPQFPVNIKLSLLSREIQGEFRGKKDADIPRSAACLSTFPPITATAPSKRQSRLEVSFNPQELFLFLPISRETDSQCCQRYVFRQGSDDRQMNDFRGEERQLQHVGNK